VKVLQQQTSLRVTTSFIAPYFVFVVFGYW